MHISFTRRALATIGLVTVSTAGLAVAAGPTVSTAGAAGTPTISVGDASVHEGDTGGKRTLSFNVAMSEPAATAVTFQYSLMAMSATAGSDYKPLRGGTKTLTLKAGQVQKPVNVPVIPDVASEGDEQLHVMLSNPTGGAVIGDAQGVGTIIDDEAGSGLRLGVGDVSVHEGHAKTRTAKFWVTLSDKAAAPVSVTAMIMPSTASSGSDYKAKNKILNFKAGQFKKAVSVRVLSDVTDESDEQFMVMLQNANGAAVADNMGMGTIVDDDDSVPVTTESFSVGPFNLAPQGQAGDDDETQAPVPRPAGHIGIKGMRFDVKNALGQSVGHDVAHLHHIVMLDQSRPDSLCPSLPNRFGGTGMERTELNLSGDYVYETGASDPWRALWHLMNRSATAQTLYITYEVDYITDLTNARPVSTYFYDVDGCWGDSEFDVPGGGGPGSIFTKSATYTAPRAGTRVFTGGHVHPGGQDITLSQNGNAVCTSTANYMPNGMLHSITPCSGETPVTAGMNLNVTGRYDNENAQLGQMGIMLSYVWEP